jgi:ATP-binding protein involved in chromosome partitioning
MPYTVDEIRKKIENVIDPSTGESLKANDAIKHVGVDEEQSSVVCLIEIGVKNNEFSSQLTRNIAKIVKLELGYKSLVVDYEQARPKTMGKKMHILAIASGKGGVGKSTVTANLALAMTSMGKKVGIIDADIYGSNMPKIFDIENEELSGTEDGKIYPFKTRGLEIVSAEFMTESGKALMWRGPMLGKILKIFVSDTIWDQDLDFMLIDLPPGTGDVAMDVKNLIPDAKVLIVTTPHVSASHIAIKAGFAAAELKQEVIGVIENMSFLEINDEKHYVFGQGGGALVSEKLQVPLLSTIPIGQPTSGHHSLFADTELIGIMYLNLARKIIKSFSS